MTLLKSENRKRTLNQPRPHHTWGRFAGAQPREVLSLLSQASEREAAAAYRNMDEAFKIPDLDARIADARMDATKGRLRGVSGPLHALVLLQEQAVGVLPGDDQVFGFLAPMFRDGVQNLGASVDNFRAGLVFLALHRKFAGELDGSQFERRYGQWFADGTITDAKARARFLEVFPESQYAIALQDRMTEEASQRRTRAEQDDLWSQVELRGDEMATLAYKIRFGEKYFPRTRHNRRGLDGMRRYRLGLTRDAFCPAKLEFLEKAGVAEYNRRATAHCKDEAPSDVGVGGAEVTLTNDCRVALST